MSWVGDAKAVGDSRNKRKINQKSQGQMGSQEAYKGREAHEGPLLANIIRSRTQAQLKRQEVGK